MVNRQSWLNNTKNLGSAGTLDGDELIRLVDDPTGTPASKQTTVTGISNRVVTDLGSLGYTIEWAGPWQISTSYNLQEATEYSGSSYICILGHTSTLADRPGTGANWQTYWDVLALEGDISVASTYATQAGLYATQALNARDDILAALSSSSDAKIYTTYAAANAALGSLSNGDTVEVSIDETRGGARTRYEVVGGVLTYVLTFPFNNSVTPVRYPSDLDDTESLQRAVTEAGPNGSIVLKPGHSYEVRARVTFLPNQKMDMNGATIKLCDQAITTTTQAVDNSTTSFTVTDASDFKIGMSIVIANQGVLRKDLVYLTSLSTNNAVITNIVGNTITISSSFTITGTFNSGSSIISAFIPLYGDNRVTIENGIIDGNRANRPWARWETDYLINFPIGSEFCTVQNMILQNAPSEGISWSGKGHKCVNNIFRTFGGNGTHFSDSTDMLIQGCSFYDGNLDIDVGHENGGITWSNGISRSIIKDNYVENFMSGIGGFDGTNYDTIIEGNFFVNNKVWGIYIASDASRLIASNNYLKNNAQDISLVSGIGYSSTGGIFINSSTGVDLAFNNNYIEETAPANAFYSSGNTSSRNLTVSNNTILGVTLFSGIRNTIFNNNLLRSKLSIGLSENVQISNNTFDLKDNTTDIVISFYSSGNYHNVSFENNNVYGGVYGVSISSGITSIKNFKVSNNNFFDQTARGVSSTNTTATVSGLLVSGNNIQPDTNSGASYNGITSSTANITISDNNITESTGTAASKVAINSTVAASLGSMVIINGNYVKGAWSNAVSMTANAGSFCINNFVDSGTIGSGTGNTISGTVTI